LNDGRFDWQHLLSDWSRFFLRSLLFSFFFLLQILLFLLFFLIFIQLLSLFLFFILLWNLFFFIIVSSLFIINEESRIVGEQLFTGSQLTSFLLDFLILFVFLFLLIGLLSPSSVFFPLQKHLISHQRTWIIKELLDLFCARSLFLSSSIFSSMLIYYSTSSLPPSLLSL